MNKNLFCTDTNIVQGASDTKVTLPALNDFKMQTRTASTYSPDRALDNNDDDEMVLNKFSI